MQDHAIYWKRLMDDGMAIVFGLTDRRGPWGMGIVEVVNESDAYALGTDDPLSKKQVLRLKFIQCLDP